MPSSADVDHNVLRGRAGFALMANPHVIFSPSKFGNAGIWRPCGSPLPRIDRPERWADALGKANRARSGISASRGSRGLLASGGTVVYTDRDVEFAAPPKVAHWQPRRRGGQHTA